MLCYILGLSLFIFIDHRHFKLDLFRASSYEHGNRAGSAIAGWILLSIHTEISVRPVHRDEIQET